MESYRYDKDWMHYKLHGDQHEESLCGIPSWEVNVWSDGAEVGQMIALLLNHDEGNLVPRSERTELLNTCPTCLGMAVKERLQWQAYNWPAYREAI